MLIFSLVFVTDTSGLLKQKIYLNAEFRLISPMVAGVETFIVPEPNQVKDKENPINGVLMTGADYEQLLLRTPIAISTNNFTSARPQYGLSKADVVLEVLAEGGITRYVPVFYQNYDVTKVGPVRSLRYYMITFASEYADAIILHEGWAGFDNAPDEHYREQTDARGAVFKYRIKSMQTAASRYRDKEKAKKDGYVHSLYTDFGRINPEIERLKKAYGWKIGSATGLEPLKFKTDAPLEERGDFKKVTTQFLSLNKSEYTSGFNYDKESNTYKRFIWNKDDIDLLTGEQIAPKNVIIEWHNYGDAGDGHGRIIIDMIAEDKVVILNDGKVQEGKWKKECRTCRTKYFDANGAEIPLVRGQNWVQIAVKVGDRLVSNVKFD